MRKLILVLSLTLTVNVSAARLGAERGRPLEPVAQDGHHRLPADVDRPRRRRAELGSAHEAHDRGEGPMEATGGDVANAARLERDDIVHRKNAALLRDDEVRALRSAFAVSEATTWQKRTSRSENGAASRSVLRKIAPMTVFLH